MNKIRIVLMLCFLGGIFLASWDWTNSEGTQQSTPSETPKDTPVRTDIPNRPPSDSPRPIDSGLFDGIPDKKSKPASSDIEKLEKLYLKQGDKKKDTEEGVPKQSTTPKDTPVRTAIPADEKSQPPSSNMPKTPSEKSTIEKPEKQSLTEPSEEDLRALWDFVDYTKILAERLMLEAEEKSRYIDELPQRAEQARRYAEEVRPREEEQIRRNEEEANRLSGEAEDLAGIEHELYERLQRGYREIDAVRRELYSATHGEINSHEDLYRRTYEERMRIIEAAKNDPNTSEQMREWLRLHEEWANAWHRKHMLNEQAEEFRHNAQRSRRNIADANERAQRTENDLRRIDMLEMEEREVWDTYNEANERYLRALREAKASQRAFEQSGRRASP